MDNNNKNNIDYSDLPQRDYDEREFFTPDEMDTGLDGNHSFNPIDTVEEALNNDPLGNYDEKAVRTGENIVPGSDEDAIRQLDIADSPEIVENIKPEERFDEPELDEEGFGPQTQDGLEQDILIHEQMVKDELAKSEQQLRDEQLHKEELDKQEQFEAEELARQDLQEQERVAAEEQQAREVEAATQAQPEPEATPEHVEQASEPQPADEPQQPEQPASEPEPQEQAPEITPKSNIETHEQSKMWEIYGTVHHKKDLANVRFEDTSFLRQKLKGADPVTIKVGAGASIYRVTTKKYNGYENYKVTFGRGKNENLRDKEEAVNLALTIMIQKLNAEQKPGEPINTSAVTISGTPEFQKIAHQQLEKLEFDISRGEFPMPNGAEGFRPCGISKENIIGAAQEQIEASPSIIDKAKSIFSELKDIAAERTENNSISSQEPEPTLENEPIAFEDMSEAEQRRITREMEREYMEKVAIEAEMREAELEATGITDEDRFGVQAQNKETEAALAQMQENLTDEIPEPELVDDAPEINDFDEPEPETNNTAATGLLLETSRQAHAQELKAEAEIQNTELTYEDKIRNGTYKSFSEVKKDYPEVLLSPAEFDEIKVEKSHEDQKNESTYVDRIHNGELTSFSQVNKEYPEAMLTPASFKLIQERKLNPLEPKQEEPKKPQRERSGDLEPSF